MGTAALAAAGARVKDTHGFLLLNSYLPCCQIVWRRLPTCDRRRNGGTAEDFFFRVFQPIRSVRYCSAGYWCRLLPAGAHTRVAQLFRVEQISSRHFIKTRGASSQYVGSLLRGGTIRADYFLIALYDSICTQNVNMRTELLLLVKLRRLLAEGKEGRHLRFLLLLNTRFPW